MAFNLFKFMAAPNRYHAWTDEQGQLVIDPATGQPMQRGTGVVRRPVHFPAEHRDLHTEWQNYGYVNIDETGNIIPRAGEEKRKKNPTFVQPVGVSQPVNPALSPKGPQTGVSRGEQGVVSTDYVPTDAAAMEEHIANELREFTDTGGETPLALLPEAWDYIGGTTQSNDQAKQWMADTAMKKLVGKAQEGGSGLNQVAEEHIKKFLGMMLGEEYAVIPDKYKNLFVEIPHNEDDEDIYVEHDEEEELDSTLEHARWMEAGLREQPNSPIMQFYQSYKELPEVNAGFEHAINDTLSDRLKYGYFTMFPEDIPADVQSFMAVPEYGFTSDVVGKMTGKALSSRINTLEPDHPIRKGLSDALTQVIGDSFSPSRVLPDDIPVPLTRKKAISLLGDNDSPLTNFEKFFIRRAWGWAKGDDGDLEREKGVAPARGAGGVERNDVQRPEQEDTGSIGKVEDAATSVAKQQMISITKPTVTGVLDLVKQVSDGWREQIMAKQSKNMLGQLEYADTLELIGELAKGSLENLNSMSPEELQVNLGDNATLTGGNLSIKFQPVVDEFDPKRISSYKTPNLGKFATGEQVNAIIKKLINEKRQVLAIQNNAQRVYGDLDPIDAIVAYAKKNLTPPGMDFSRQFVQATLAQGAKGIDQYGKQAERIKNDPRAYMKHNIFTALPLLKNLVKNNREQYNSEVVKAFFSLIGTRPSMMSPVKAGEDGNVQWIDPGISNKVRQPQIDPETGLLVKVPALSGTKEWVTKSGLYYFLTGEPVDSNMKLLFEESGLAKTEKPKIDRGKGVDGKEFIIKRADPIMQIDEQGYVTPIKSKYASMQEMFIKHIYKFAFRELAMLHNAKKTMLKQSSVQRVKEGCDMLEARKRQIYDYVSQIHLQLSRQTCH